MHWRPLSPDSGSVRRAQEGVLALWVTNRERLRRFVEAELLPAWGLAPAAQWLWLKVTARGALVSPLARPARPGQRA